MVGYGSAGEPSRAKEGRDGLSARERRGLDRCRRALERGRRVRGRPVAESHRDGLLLELGGVLGHVPAADAAARRPAPRLWGPRESQWQGWVAAVGPDLVHLVAERPGPGDAPVHAAEVVEARDDDALVRLGDGSPGVVPWDELSWEPALEPRRLEPGARLEGRVVGITLEGPLLSPRAVLPSPWPAVALALPRGTRVAARVEALHAGHALVRTDRAPRAAAVVREEALALGEVVEATVARVNATAGVLVLDDLRPRSRAPRLAPAARTPGPQGPGRAA